MVSNPPDPYVGLVISGYTLEKQVGSGQIGTVYQAIRKDPYDVWACKIIPEGKLRHGWERELQKISRLRGIPEVVQFHTFGGDHDKDHRPFSYVMFDFISGQNLGKYLESPAAPINIAFVETLAEALLRTLHACEAESISHGDLHAGNIMISEPDGRVPGSPRRVFITDFGYGGSHNAIQPKDDRKQIASIVLSLLNPFDPHELAPRDRVLHRKLSDFMRKGVLEEDHTQLRYVAGSTSLYDAYQQVRRLAERESAAAQQGIELRGPDDYLVAEALGYRVDEWQNLFVPVFLGASDLLSRNITVLTGARGCGKTMAFRRLTLFMDQVIGAPSGVKGADDILGFYLNCRDLVEAFPWTPRTLNRAAKEQVTHYFHLAWLTEIVRSLALAPRPAEDKYRFVSDYLRTLYGDRYQAPALDSDHLHHIRAFVESEKERCRKVKVGSLPGLENWPLARLDFLDTLQAVLSKNLPWVGTRPTFLFLDDYTVPTITREVQNVLNQVVFKRRADIFFKVSTESANSFSRVGPQGKPMELDHDFKLLDLANESLHQPYERKFDLLDRIFQRRILRHEGYQSTSYGLKDVLGESRFSNNELAQKLRQIASRNAPRERIYYAGADSFVGMWSSDIRTMIQVFTDVLKDNWDRYLGKRLKVDQTIQDKRYKDAGGEFLAMTEHLKNPVFWETSLPPKKPTHPYGGHLRDIAQAFINIARYELTKGNLVSNQGAMNPRQAFRIEIIDQLRLPDDVIDYYQGLIRWHIFLPDWRGKSVRGMLTPRLFLNRLLLPFANLTFSSHDNISLRNEEFVSLLRSPNSFLRYWNSKRTRKGKDPGTGNLPF